MAPIAHISALHHTTHGATWRAHTGHNAQRPACYLSDARTTHLAPPHRTRPCPASRRRSRASVQPLCLRCEQHAPWWKAVNTTLLSAAVGLGALAWDLDISAWPSSSPGGALAASSQQSRSKGPPPEPTKPPKEEEEQDLSISFNASPDASVRAEQIALVEAWGYARQYYVDDTLGGLGPAQWTRELQAALDRTFAGPDGRAMTPREVRAEAGALVGRLGDPFTRVADPLEASALNVESEGTVEGVGAVLTIGPQGEIKVSAVLRNSPAAQAQLRPGDVVVAVQGQRISGGEPLAALQLAADLLGPGGREVEITVLNSSGELVTKTLQKATVKLTPLKLETRVAAPVKKEASRKDAKGPDVGSAGPRIGYLRISAFTNTIGEETAGALCSLGADVEGLVLDVRNNPGGVVQSGLDVASLLLPPEAPFATVRTRGGDKREYRVGAEALQLAQAASTCQGGSPAVGQTLPLAVLVDGNSASTAELVAGAVQSDGRGLLVGPSKTFGKGRTQAVFELSNKSSLLVTVALFETPAGQVVDKVGLTPDVTCKSPAKGSPENMGDPCLAAAEKALSDKIRSKQG